LCTIECCHQGIRRGCDIVGRFCDISHEGNLLASEFESLKICVLLYEFGGSIWNTTLWEALQDDVEWEWE
jgi:hypothetical protein